ncbi:unnamed protein product [Brassicogethes aeneus]|uniref:Exportin-4 n=1 Tax=Brassicogethes aeneus TaxID=1431903 RepID=A0A9P0B2B4_BRAAE|nr:unnamed protein product [Brassicogethes aeneus]
MIGLISELEAAAGIIMAPTNVVSSEQRHAAENVFLNFRKSKSPYSVCREILEKSQNEYILFEAAEVIRGAIIREWSFLMEDDRDSLRQYLFQYITNKAVPQFVQNRILQTIAIMVKRASINDGGRNRTVVLQDVENLVINGDHKKKMLGCFLIKNLLQEYSNTLQSTDVGLPFEVHFKAKKDFESFDLKRIFQFCVYLLSEVVNTDPPYQESMLQLTNQVLIISETVLQWAYIAPMLPRRIINLYERVYQSEEPPHLKLDKHWADVILNPEIMTLMFRVFWKIRDQEELAHHALACLVQLSTLNGPVVSEEAESIKYLQNFVVNFLNLVSNVTIRKRESVAIANIVNKLNYFSDNDLRKLPKELTESMYDEFSRLTCSFCDLAVNEEAQGEEDKFFGDAFTIILSSWDRENLMTDRQEKMRYCPIAIFNKYLQVHLAPPDGTRQPCADDADEIEDNEDNDRIKYKDNLQVVGQLARYVLDHSLSVLLNVLDTRINKLVNHVQTMQNRAMNISEAASLDNLFEDIHWALLITGNVLCIESQGECASVPSEIMSYSLRQWELGHTTIEATMNTLAAMGAKSGEPHDFDKCDMVFKILYVVLKLSFVEEYAIANKLGHFMSPELGSTLMWFLRSWCVEYLLPCNVKYLGGASPILLDILEEDPKCAMLLFNMLISKVQSNMYFYQSEPILMRDTVDLFCDIVCIKQKNTCVVKTEGMRRLIQWQQALGVGVLPPGILKNVMKGIILAGSTIKDPNELNAYYDLILRPVQNRLKTFLSQENLTRVYHNEDVQKVFIDIVELLSGVVIGVQSNTASNIFQFIAPMLGEIPVFMTVYSNYQIIVQLILELFCDCAKNILCFLSPNHTKTLYDCSLAIVQNYSKCNANRFTSEAFAEESNLQDLALVLDLFTHTLSKDCIDMYNINTNEETLITASDVALFGLNFVMPLMTIDLLKYPCLCAQYYRLLVLINDIYPEKIVGLPQNLRNTMLQSIEIGLTSFGQDAVHNCLEFLEGLALHVFKQKLAQTEFGQAIKYYLKLLMDLTLSHQICSDLISSASVIIYELICSFQDEYQMLVNSLIQMQTDPLVAERLAAAFNSLMLNVNLTCERQQKTKFKDNFDKFIANVHGFLIVK